MEERPPIRRVTANILKKHLLIADRGFPPAWGLGEMVPSHHKNVFRYEIFIQSVYGWLILRCIFRK